MKLYLLQFLYIYICKSIVIFCRQKSVDAEIQSQKREEREEIDKKLLIYMPLCYAKVHLIHTNTYILFSLKIYIKKYIFPDK